MDSPPWNLPESNFPSQAESDLDQSHPRMENKIQAEAPEWIVVESELFHIF